MFGWRPRPEHDESSTETKIDLERLRQDDVAILFKHSPTCPVSWAAHIQMRSFIARNPAVPVYTISVRDDRTLSRQIAEWTHVEHESPQVIVLRRGVVVSSTSHGGVTARYLTGAIAREPETLTSR